jgi:UDP-glucose 4-epimerase
MYSRRRLKGEGVEILVTGGAGFIGSHVAEAYLSEGHEVFVIDDLSTGRREFVPAGAKWVHLDITDRARLEELFRRERFALVNHHAAQVDVRHSVADPQRDAQVNILGTVNLLEACRKFSVSQFLFISSGGVLYGEPARLPATEDFTKMPLSPYGVSKLAAEFYLYSYRVNFGLQYITLRYANVYGPRQTPKSEANVISTFARQMLAGQTVTIFGEGEQTRDYIFISDVVRANLLATQRLIELNAREPQELDDLAFNIGTGQETTVNEIFAQLQPLTGFSGQAQYAPPRTGEIRRNALNGEKAARLLGFRPQVGVAEGLRETVAWLK